MHALTSAGAYKMSVLNSCVSYKKMKLNEKSRIYIVLLNTFGRYAYVCLSSYDLWSDGLYKKQCAAYIYFLNFECQINDGL